MFTSKNGITYAISNEHCRNISKGYGKFSWKVEARQAWNETGYWKHLKNIRGIVSAYCNQSLPCGHYKLEWEKAVKLTTMGYRVDHRKANHINK